MNRRTDRIGDRLLIGHLFLAASSNKTKKSQVGDVPPLDGCKLICYQLVTYLSNIPEKFGSRQPIMWNNTQVNSELLSLDQF